ncbi:peptide/nickel transport system substrate-binding protein/oligopeptide transport system substrate-binding protein [Stackebrandtia albiflava]|uniref:Peptide/nickel transport system substrate-binding protein/oligopeptide transport system substrate-binding protein n=1 Tax=Stackebrandtia albiflava TaxID=406432 RepID=A0A562UPS2_9ACTN|nr:ABC transporter substrate-binding protein [Stackebrandtia albiflava]TWJ07610.1 peptide/nickel transport system substrate-binding protein/oligopeptide transport system substrate-binding protein [Stackebrandtia albiflava]
MRNNRRVITAISALALTGVGLAACGGGDGGSGSGSGSDGTLRLGLGEPQNLIPANIQETEGGEIADRLYAGLYTYDMEGNLAPVLADGVPTTEDNKVWTIKLQEGFTFQNGEEITAETFVKSWNYTVYGENANYGAGFFKQIDGWAEMQLGEDPDGDGPEEAAKPEATELSGVKAVDPLTLEVTLAEPWVGFPVTLGYTAFMPMADECLADIDACNETPIGNGPYKIDGKWNHNSSIHMEKWADYKGTQPSIERIEYKIYTGDATAWPDFEAGKIDIAAPGAEEYEVAKAEYGDAMREEETGQTWGLGFPVYDEKFSDPNVRKAFSMAIDRQGYIDGLFQGRYTVANSYTPAVIPGYLEGTCGEACTFDPEAAKQLLADTDFPMDQPVELWVNSGPGEDYLKVLGDQLAANLGITYELKTLEWPDFLGKKDGHELTGPFLTGWSPDYPLNQNYLEPLYGNGPDGNDFGFHGEEFEQLLAEGNRAETLSDAMTKYQEAEKVLAADLPVAPIWVTRTATVIGENVDPDSFQRNPILGTIDINSLKLL